MVCNEWENVKAKETCLRWRLLAFNLIANSTLKPLAAPHHGLSEGVKKTRFGPAW